MFVGRERELADILGAFDDARSGTGRLVLLTGEPGIGKSRLADELAAHAQARGTTRALGSLLGGGWCTGVLALGAGTAVVRPRPGSG